LSETMAGFQFCTRGIFQTIQVTNGLDYQNWGSDPAISS
jgi:hypothetical protein